MNKLSYLLMGFAALSFAACSSDEPTPAPTPDGEGTTLYLNVNITDANNARSRAGNLATTPDEAKEGDYIYGNADEHYVNSADFFFFDADGRYVTRANVWRNGGDGTTTNIEYMGVNTLVLRNLSKNNLPAYVMTVLNAPAGFADQVEQNNLTMKQLAEEQFNIFAGKTDANKDIFVMSTTSYLDGGDRWNKDFYYATKLKSGDFMTEVPTTDDVKNKAVEIYVERLAAKFQLTGISKDATFPVEVTIAGNPNGESGSIKPEPDDEGNVENVPSAATKLYVKIEGFGLTGQEKKSFLSKNLEGFSSTNLWTGWNHPEFYRSYWAKSLTYGANPDLQYTTFKDAKNDPTKPIYGIETTNDFANLQGAENALKTQLVTNVILTARVYSDKACTKPVDLVEYDGVYFTKAQYMKYVLGKLLAGEGLQYWTNETTSEKTVTTETEEGTKVETITVFHYDALTIDDFTCDWTDDATTNATGAIVIAYTPAEGTKLYKKPEGWKEGDKLADASAADVNAELAKFNAQTTATAFNGGSMFYSVPVEHLEGTDQNKNYKVTANGQYGIVRNHWYMLNVSKIISLGHGVFKPGDLEGSNETEEIIPDDNSKEKFALAAKINILSWKIVQQNVEL